MTLEEAIAQFRTDTADLASPYLSTDEQITAWLAEAQEEAAIRANLLFEASSTEICDIAVSAGVMTYPLHNSVVTVTYAEFTPVDSTEAVEVKLADRVALDRDFPGWRAKTDVPSKLIVDQVTMQLGCKPSTAGTLHIECYRTPLTVLADTEEFEIPSVHHRHLIQWALHKCYARPDAELFDPKRSESALDTFTKVFGTRPDADLRQDFRANTPAHNQAYW